MDAANAVVREASLSSEEHPGSGRTLHSNGSLFQRSIAELLRRTARGRGLPAGYIVAAAVQRGCDAKIFGIAGHGRARIERDRGIEGKQWFVVSSKLSAKPAFEAWI